MATASIKVWDIVVRVFHWSLVLFVTVSFFTGEVLETVHAYSGYIIIALLAIRIVWGFIGTHYARFSNFIYSPKTIISYLKNLSDETADNYIGHNPVGGAMIIFMILFFGVTAWTGLKAYAEEGKGPLAAVEMSSTPHVQADVELHDGHKKHAQNPEKKDEFWEDVHEIVANFMILIVLLHIGGVLISSEILKEDLIRPMLTGYKEEHDKTDK